MTHHSGNILVVDDDPAVREMIADYLTGEEYSVHEACDGAEMRSAMAEVWPDLVLLDLRLPGEDGFTLIRELATRHPNLPVMILSGKDEVADRVTGLEIGADDYLVKPFELRELLARVRTVLRRQPASVAPPDSSAAMLDPQPVYLFAGWRMDTAFRTLTNENGEIVNLTSGEFDLLRVFAEHPNRPLTRDQLLDLARHRDSIAGDRSIDVLVGRLRRKIERNPRRPVLIRTVRSVGYVLDAVVKKENTAGRTPLGN